MQHSVFLRGSGRLWKTSARRIWHHVRTVNGCFMAKHHEASRGRGDRGVLPARRSEVVRAAFMSWFRKQERLLRFNKDLNNCADQRWHFSLLLYNSGDLTPEWVPIQYIWWWIGWNMAGYFGNFTIRNTAACWKCYSEAYAGRQVPILVVKTCTTAADTGEKEGEAGVKHGGWRRQHRVEQQAMEKIKTRQQTVPLPEHLGERGVAVIWPGGRRGAGQGRAGRGEERVNHTEGKTGLLEGCDWKRD